MMIRLIATLSICISLTAKGQYYYKDIITPKHTAELLKKYKEQRVKNVKVISYESTGEQTVDFDGSQVMDANYARISTYINTALTGSSELTTHFNGSGQLLKTIDTTDGSRSESEYYYNNRGQTSRIINISTSSGQKKEKEEHNWFYNEKGQPLKMLRIKNDVDTTYISFVLEENGNVAEENSLRNGVEQQSYYYYYDKENRLTDIVTYSRQAKRLLPVYIFEYNEGGSLKTMLVVPEGSDDYQKWIYEYNEGGLKTKETCFNKRRQLMGKIEYVYGK